MSVVIEIQFSTDLRTDKLNELRYRMELASWRLRMREARRKNDYDAMDRLGKEYEMVGMP